MSGQELACHSNNSAGLAEDENFAESVWNTPTTNVRRTQSVITTDSRADLVTDDPKKSRIRIYCLSRLKENKKRNINKKKCLQG